MIAPETVSLVKALRAVTSHIPAITDALLASQMVASKQREYAGMLRELAVLLEDHAEVTEQVDTEDGASSHGNADTTGDDKPRNS